MLTQIKTPAAVVGLNDERNRLRSSMLPAAAAAASLPNDGGVVAWARESW
jgi:hypothetical protein